MRLRTAFSLMACICVLLFSSRDAFAAKIFVTYTDQKVAGQGTGGCSLQEAIYSSVLHDTLDGVHGLAITSTDPDGFVTTDCVKGDGDDTIVLPTKGTMTMNADVSWDAYNPFGPTATPLIYSTITIEGNGATIVAQYSVLVRHFRLFAIGAASVKTPNGTAAGTGTLTLRNVQITGFHVKGGNGNNGGGGGLGAGGAIYVGKVNTNALPTLTIENSTFDSNGANGGLGGGGLGGGGGGMGGNGGPSNAFDTSGGGGARGDGGTGGGGGTVFPGVGLNGGYLNGGDGAPGFDVIDGDPAKGPGGGGGSGRERLCDVPFVCSKYGNGGPGGYGGGGGGGMNNGGAGGFGGGGGSSFSFDDGGHGGFGGGGGSGSSGAAGGAFGGHAADSAGGGGGALGGAIFNDGGTITVRNSTFLKNFVSRGTGGLACAPDVPDVCDPPGENGGDAGGAIFSRDGNLTVENSTFSANESTGSGGAIVDYSDFSSASGPFLVFTLNNTIIANNGANECFFTGDVTAEGLGNLITANGTGVQPFGSCPSPDVTADPQLGLLQDNGGFTQTMAIPFGGVAMGAADPSTSLATDQRGETRPQANGFDIGAYEVCRKSLGEMIVPFACSETTFNGSSTSPLTIAATSSSGAGGTVSPVPGTYDEPKDTVVLLTATPSAGYYLKSWTGNVAAPNITTTTIIIGDVAQSVTANFQLHDFTLAASPTTFTIPLGATTLTSGLTATALGDFGDSISLTAAGQPAGVKASLSANPLKPVVGTPAASTLTIAVGPSAVPQSFAETITGRSTGLSGALSHPAQVNVTFVMTAAALINIIKQDLALGCIGTSGLAQALIAKVNAFQTLSSTGQKQPAANLLVAFQNEVLGQTGRQIAATCTDPVGGNQFSAGQTLILDAQALQAGTLGSQVKGMPIVGLVLNSVNTEVQGATVNLMSSSNTVIATATTDAAGFYYFIGTSGMTVGADYSVSVANKKSGSTIPSQTLAWGAATTVLKTFILN